VVEDHPEMRERIISLLDRDFEVVESVSNGAAAVETENRLKPDILVLDVALPILDGVSVAKRLKIEGSKAKIVFISVSEDPDQVTACFAAGGDAYVSKMLMGTDLNRAVKEVLAGRTFVSSPWS